MILKTAELHILCNLMKDMQLCCFCILFVFYCQIFYPTIFFIIQIHRRNISLSSVLGCYERKADSHCFQKKIVDKCYLPCQRYCGKRIP